MAEDLVCRFCEYTYPFTIVKVHQTVKKLMFVLCKNFEILNAKSVTSLILTFWFLLHKTTMYKIHRSLIYLMT